MLDNETLKQVLLGGSYITEENYRKAEEFSSAQHLPLTDYLFSEGLLTKSLLGQAIAEHFGVPFSDLSYNPPPTHVILKIPEEISRKSRLILCTESKTGITIATDDPKQADLGSLLSPFFPDRAVSITYSLPEDIDLLLARYQKPIETRFQKIIDSNSAVAPRLLEEIFSDAISLHASDIHFEPHLNDIVIRFRVDGVLREAGRIGKEYYENILNRIKIQNRMRIDQHFDAQDGSMRYEHDELVVDLRTSIIPTIEGEKVVLRILASYFQGLNLPKLGLSAVNQDLIEKAAQKPFGMILVTGPTGSGKTTTLYALIKMLNRPNVNITTIEDPVEYKIPGINQIQVNTLTNLTFGKGIRSIVRQDPDIILVGEIRDTETAEVAVNAALTGHLLLSTFHANDAATALPRLLDMGIEPFLLSSTIEVVASQRLVRTLCEHCRYSVKVNTDSPRLKNIAEFFAEKEVTLYDSKKCESCNFTGYKGRTGIFEFISVSPELKSLLMTNPSSQEIWSLARNQGSRSMFEDGVEKVQNGITSLEELLRVVEPPARQI